MMKKLLFTFATGIFLTAGSIAQTNLNLEAWTGNECDGWGSINSFTILGAPQTLYQETVDVAEGSSAAKIVTGYWAGATNFGASSDTVSGFLTIGGAPTSPMGIPYTEKPVSIDFSIKADLEPGDTGAVFVQLSYWDNTLNMQIPVAQALVPVIDSSGWQNATATPFYFAGNTPDTLQIICVSSMGSLLGSPLPIINSTIYVDGFVINLPVGVEERDEDVKFSIYPNPASDYIVIKNGSSKSDMDVDMIDINGKLVKSYTDVSGGEITIAGTDLSSGVYFVKVTSGGKQVIKQIIFE